MSAAMKGNAPFWRFKTLYTGEALAGNADGAAGRLGDDCYDKHALRADVTIPRMFFSPTVLRCYSTYARLIRTPSFHYDSTSCITPCLTPAIVLLTYDTLFPCSSYVSSLFTNTVCP